MPDMHHRARGRGGRTRRYTVPPTHESPSVVQFVGTRAPGLKVSLHFAEPGIEGFVCWAGGTPRSGRGSEVEAPQKEEEGKAARRCERSGAGVSAGLQSVKRLKAREGEGKCSRAKQAWETR